MTQRTYILITRPEPDASAFARMLETAHIPTLCEPLLTITQKLSANDKLGSRQWQGIIITSKHAEAVLRRIPNHTTIPCFSVGSSPLTKNAACYTAPDAASLAEHVVRETNPNGEPLLYLRGEHVAFPMKETLRTHGLNTEEVIVYTAEASQSLSYRTIEAIQMQHIGVVTFFSARTAETFCALIEKEGLGKYCKHLTALCISNHVADIAQKLSWNAVKVASSPNQEAMVDATKELMHA